MRVVYNLNGGKAGLHGRRSTAASTARYMWEGPLTDTISVDKPEQFAPATSLFV